MSQGSTLKKRVLSSEFIVRTMLECNLAFLTGMTHGRIFWTMNLKTFITIWCMELCKSFRHGLHSTKMINQHEFLVDQKHQNVMEMSQLGWVSKEKSKGMKHQENVMSWFSVSRGIKKTKASWKCYILTKLPNENHAIKNSCKRRTLVHCLNENQTDQSIMKMSHKASHGSRHHDPMSKDWSKWSKCHAIHDDGMLEGISNILNTSNSLKTFKSELQNFVLIETLKLVTCLTVNSWNLSCSHHGLITALAWC